MSPTTCILVLTLHDSQTGLDRAIVLEETLSALREGEWLHFNLIPDPQRTLKCSRQYGNDSVDSSGTIGPDCWIEFSESGQKPRFLGPGAYASFEKARDGLKFREGYPGYAEQIRSLNDQQKESWMEQVDDWETQRMEVTEADDHGVQFGAEGSIIETVND
jgi:hypothetical protein